MTDEKIIELIGRRRRQILVHSYIYYVLDKNIISDAQWSEWAKELYDLQIKYPELASKAPLHDDFIDFDYSTGCDLNFRNPWVINKASQLLKGESK